MHDPPFDVLTDIYEALVDWPARLAREASFYRRLLADHDVSCVMDAACGIGHHASMFHQWGFTVEGADISPTMIERARHRFGEPRGLRWSVRSFQDPVPSNGPIDAVICVGNSLALAEDLDAAQRALGNLLGALRPAGLLVVQVLNLLRLEDGPCNWQKSVAVHWSSREAIATKGVRRCGNGGYIDLVVNGVTPPELLFSQSIPVLQLTTEHFTSDTLQPLIQDATFYGDFQRNQFHEPSSHDLIAVLVRSP